MKKATSPTASKADATYKQKCLKINSRAKLSKYNGMYYIVNHRGTTLSSSHPTPANAWADCYEFLIKSKKA